MRSVPKRTVVTNLPKTNPNSTHLIHVLNQYQVHYELAHATHVEWFVHNL